MSKCKGAFIVVFKHGTATYSAVEFRKIARNGLQIRDRYKTTFLQTSNVKM
jgi:hypothetical protein